MSCHNSIQFGRGCLVCEQRVFLAVDIGAFGQHGKALWQGFQRTGQRWPYPAAFAAGYAVARPYAAIAGERAVAGRMAVDAHNHSGISVALGTHIFRQGGNGHSCTGDRQGAIDKVGLRIHNQQHGMAAVAP